MTLKSSLGRSLSPENLAPLVCEIGVTNALRCWWLKCCSVAAGHLLSVAAFVLWLLTWAPPRPPGLRECHPGWGLWPQMGGLLPGAHSGDWIAWSRQVTSGAEEAAAGGIQRQGQPGAVAWAAAAAGQGPEGRPQRLLWEGGGRDWTRAWGRIVQAAYLLKTLGSSGGGEGCSWLASAPSRPEVTKAARLLAGVGAVRSRRF